MAFWVVLRTLFLFPFAQLKKLASQDVDVGRRRSQDERDGLEWLQWMLPRIRAALSVGEQRQMKNEILSLWLQDIKDLAHEVEDVIDEFEYEELRHRVEEGGTSQRCGLSRSPTTSNEAMVRKMTEIRRRWEDIARVRNDLISVGDLDGSAYQGDDPQEIMSQAGSLLKGQVFGREKERDEIVEFLLGADVEIGHPAVAITGFGGLGKTTLAQLVYNDEKITNHFDLKMWVCVIAPDFDVEILTEDILVSADHGYNFHSSCGIPKNLDVLQRKLMEKVEGMRFLLVIDNLWDRDYSKWQHLCAPLMVGEKRSKVVITTRDMKIANILQTRKTVKLQGLPLEDCWKLFERYAFVDGNSAKHPSLEAIGRQIVQKFDGVPLAATMIGCVLRQEPEQSGWMRILESEIWELEVGEDGILPVLKLSYEQLSPQLKQCFAYLSLYPKNYQFDEQELVHQWMAHGFLQINGGNRRMEDVGAKYFDDLLCRSFLHYDHGKFVMHDLIHDLALLVSRHDHLVLKKVDGKHDRLRKGTTPCRLRHVSVYMSPAAPQMDQRDLKNLSSKCRNLRTIVLHFPANCRLIQFSDDLFLCFKRLRVLDLSCGGLETLPDSIGNLIHLRYLDLGGNLFRRLPESLCRLYSLQTLKLRVGNYLMETLPQGISNMISLRHLDVDMSLLSKVSGIGKLTCLQELESFPISQGHGIKIEDLKDLNELGGALRICRLDRVTNKEKAARAMLNNKRHLRKLVMEWGGAYEYRNRELEEEILEALLPPANLKELAIDGYDGVRCPSWIENQFCFSKLESLRLGGCRYLNFLPPLQCLPFLQETEIVSCPWLKKLPSLPGTLRTLKICDVGLEELPEIVQPPEPAVGSTNSSTVPSLITLHIYRCSALRSLRQGLLSHHLGSLTTLSIQGCKQLESWPDGAGFLATLLSLQELCVEFCPKLMALPAESSLSPSLRKLSIVGCPGVASKPLFGVQLPNMSPEIIVYVENKYTSLACCSEEALQLMRTMDWLEIEDVGDDFDSIFQHCQEDHQLISLICDKRRVWSWRCDDWVLAWRVRLQVRSRGYRITLLSGKNEEMKEEKKEETKNRVSPRDWWERRSPTVKKRRSTDHEGSFLSTSLADHLRLAPWASSVRWFVAKDISAGAFLSLDLPSLEGLWIACCRDSSLLSADSPVSRLKGLKELQIFDYPDMTLLSLQQVMRSLPSLQHLTIEACPNLSSPSSSGSTPPAIASASSKATLQTLFVDDANLLGDDHFVHEQLTSLRGLHVWYSHNLTIFTAAAEEGLRSLGHSLQHLSIQGCKRLQNLPPDLRNLLPCLKVLSMKDLPNLHCLPERGLPTTLQMLVIYWCRLLESQFRPPPPHEQDGQHQQQGYWPKIARVPVIVVNGYIVKGSHREFLEGREKWKDF